MKKILYISPVSTDPEFNLKRESLIRIAEEHCISVILPLETSFDLKTSEFLQLLQSVDFVVVDLSYERPSVYFELGLACSVSNQIFLIAVVGTTLHQLPSPSHVIFYRAIDDYNALLTSLFTRDNASARDQ